MDLANKLKLFNSLSKTKEKFVPIRSGEVSMYLCGPTVYDRATIGNFRTYIFGDILYRILRYNGYNVIYAENITDVGHLAGDADTGEDKMEKGSRKIGKSAWELAEYFTKLYLEDSDSLNIKRPTIICKATDHIKEQIEMIQRLEQKGFAYRISDGIYFDTSRQKDYGKLTGLNKHGLQEGARVEINPEKKNPTDFALWKFSPKNKKRQMEWSSPWGIGFPGWHIECSAMSIKYLREPFDIHAGGIDLIPIHHTNEIAQNEALYEHKTVNYWLHGGFVLVNGQRMGKSLGNGYTISDITDKGYDPLSFRYLTYTTHYRQELNFTWQALDQAETAYKKIIKLVAEMPETNLTEIEPDKNFRVKFLEAVNDDLNMPKALAVVFEMLKDKELPEKIRIKTLLKFDEVLGLSIKTKSDKLKEEAKNISKEVEELARIRNLARKHRDWTKADELKKKIIGLGYEVRDEQDKTTLTKIFKVSAE